MPLKKRKKYLKGYFHSIVAVTASFYSSSGNSRNIGILVLMLCYHDSILFFLCVCVSACMCVHAQEALFPHANPLLSKTDLFA